MPIEQVTADDLVRSRDTRGGQWTFSSVREIFSRVYEGDVVTLQLAGETIVATGGHPFWVTDGADLDARPLADEELGPDPESRVRGRWVAARDLREGDILAGCHADLVPVERNASAPTSNRLNSVPRSTAASGFTADSWILAASALIGEIISTCGRSAPNRGSIDLAPKFPKAAEFSTTIAARRRASGRPFAPPLHEPAGGHRSKSDLRR